MRARRYAPGRRGSVHVQQQSSPRYPAPVSAWAPSACARFPSAAHRMMQESACGGGGASAERLSSWMTSLPRSPFVEVPYRGLLDTEGPTRFAPRKVAQSFLTSLGIACRRQWSRALPCRTSVGIRGWRWSCTTAPASGDGVVYPPPACVRLCRLPFQGY